MVATIPVQPLNRDGVVTAVEFSRGGRLRDAAAATQSPTIGRATLPRRLNQRPGEARRHLVAKSIEKTDGKKDRTDRAEKADAEKGADKARPDGRADGRPEPRAMLQSTQTSHPANPARDSALSRAVQ